MKLIIHDLTQKEFQELFPTIPQDIYVVGEGGPQIEKCVGCFMCWTKTPGRCVIEDGYGCLGGIMGQISELILISRVVYGSFSPFVKNVLDRNIGYVLPFFEIRNHEMHHVSRYPDRIKLTAYGYGAGIKDTEKSVFQRIVTANALNYNASVSSAIFLEDIREIADRTEVLS